MPPVSIPSLLFNNVTNTLIFFSTLMDVSTKIIRFKCLVSYFLFGNYCCLDSLYFPPFIREKNHLTGHIKWESGIPGTSLPIDLVPEVVVYLSSQRIPAVTSQAVQHNAELPHPASEGHTPTWLFWGIWRFKIKRSCVEFSNIPHRLRWHCGYRRLVFKLQVLLVLKISRPSSIICLNKKKGIPKH